MTEQNKTPLTAQPGSAPAPEQKPAEKRPAEKPLRRVGSLTLGACLIAAGVFFLLYFFVPGFDVQLTLKIAPAVALVLLGCEVLFFAARPGRWKYDFVSVLVCLVLMAGCFCMAMLPMLWDELSGENQQTMNRLSAQAIDELYTACKRENSEYERYCHRSNRRDYNRACKRLAELFSAVLYRPCVLTAVNLVVKVYSVAVY